MLSISIMGWVAVDWIEWFEELKSWCLSNLSYLRWRHGVQVMLGGRTRTSWSRPGRVWESSHALGCIGHMTCGASGTPEKKSSQIAQWRKAMAANDCEDQAWYLCICGLDEINHSLCHSIYLTYPKIQKNWLWYILLNFHFLYPNPLWLSDQILEYIP